MSSDRDMQDTEKFIKNQKSGLVRPSIWHIHIFPSFKGSKVTWVLFQLARPAFTPNWALMDFERFNLLKMPLNYNM